MGFVRLSDLKERNPIFFKRENMKAWDSHVCGNYVYGGRWIIAYDRNYEPKTKRYGIWEANGDLNSIRLIERFATLRQARAAAKKLVKNRMYEAGSNLVTFHVDLDDNLVISIASYDNARAEIEEISATQVPYRGNNLNLKWTMVPLSRDCVLWEVFSDIFCNSSYDSIRPEEIGALTAAPLISFNDNRNDHSNLLKVEKVWWYREYEVYDPIEELLKNGSIIFHKD